VLGDARAVPGRGDHRRACRRARVGRGPPRGRCSTRGCGTTSSSRSPRSPARCAASSTTCSPRARTSSRSST
jgi:hypothetical protein